jgi:hypothetical protein
MTDAPAPQLELDLDVVPDEVVRRHFSEFEVRRIDKMAVGQDRYGDRAFLGIDQIDMAMDELTDFANYAAMMYVKLGIIREFLVKHNVPLGRKLGDK